MLSPLRWFALLLCLVATPASAERRLALVIGNNAYPHLSADEQLQKAVGDATAVGDTLERLGFTVIRGTDLGRGEMLARLSALRRSLAPGDLGFVFFSGHGVAIDGANYLLPSDIPGGGDEDVVRESAVAESYVEALLTRAGVKTGVLVIDACRDNPFAGGGSKGAGGTKGLVRAEPPGGVFKLYAAGTGETALDRLPGDDPDPNSVFTRILLPELEKPGKSLVEVAYAVKGKVTELAASVGHAQHPAQYDGGFAIEVYLAGKAPEPDKAIAILPTPAPGVGKPPDANACQDAKAQFDFAARIDTAEAYQAFAEANPACPPYTAYARAMLAKLEAATVESTPPPPKAEEGSRRETAAVTPSVLPPLPKLVDTPSEAGGAAPQVLPPLPKLVDTPSEAGGAAAPSALPPLPKLTDKPGGKTVAALASPDQAPTSPAPVVPPLATPPSVAPSTVAPPADPSTSGEPARGFLGVEVQDVTADVAESFGIDAGKGAHVVRVAEGGPAAAGGIEAGDVVVEFDGREVPSMRDLPRMVADTALDKEVDVVVVRKGDRRTMSVKLGRLGEPEASAKPEAAAPLGTLVRAFEGHGSFVTSVAFSSDGRTLASGSYDKTVKLWRIADGGLLGTLQAHGGDIRSVAFSPDGQMLASGSSDNTVKLWRVADGSLIRTLEGHGNWVASVAFSPDGAVLATASWDHTARLWRVEDGSPLQTLDGDGYNVVAVAFSPDGALLAIGSGGSMVQLWRVEDGSLVRTMEGHGSLVTTVAFSPDGRTLASGSWDDTVKLWRVEDGTLLHTLAGHGDDVLSVAFSIDAEVLASGSSDETIKLWGVRDGTLLRTLEGQGLGVQSVAFSRDGATLASGTSAAKLWSLGPPGALAGK